VSEHHFPLDEYFMRFALREAARAGAAGDVPIGAVVTFQGEIIGSAGNEREVRQSPTAHAEMLAIEQAARHIGHWRLVDTAIYATIEPCPMCAGAIVLARIPRLVYGAPDEKAGATGTLFDIVRDPRLNHSVDVVGGVLEGESIELLQQFFRQRR
jgi:tRNA(adenine34) deaminase